MESEESFPAATHHWFKCVGEGGREGEAGREAKTERGRQRQRDRETEAHSPFDKDLTPLIMTLLL